MSKVERSIQEAHELLKQYVTKEQFSGYDPYDTLNSSWPFHWLGKWGPVLAIQFQKRNPFNIRPLLGIKKERNPKAIGLFLQAYSLLYKHTGKESYKQQADVLFEWLIENPTPGYQGICWGYNFDWASPVKFLEKFSPTIVVSGFIGKGVFEYYLATKNPKAEEVIDGIATFIRKELAHTEDETGVCISYSTIVKDCCYNASMLACEILAKRYHISGHEEDRILAQKIADFTVARQQPEGHWNYSIDLTTGKERTQIDFHQGYVLDSLAYFVEYCQPEDPKYQRAIEQGTRYYHQEQFANNGRSLWRVPKVWPVEIHNQSQGVLSFLRLATYYPEGKAFSAAVARWTIDNMQGKDGHFYYKKYPLYKIKTPFMRWAQAWMFLALTELLIANEGES